MRLFRWFIFTLAFCTLLPNLGGCTSRDTAPPTTPDDRAEQVNTSEPDRSLRRAPQVDTTLTAYEKQIREQLSTGKALLESGELKNDLTRFYENRHFTPVWMTTDGATRAVEALLETLRTPTPGGPFTPSYAVDRLRQRLDASGSPEARAELEVRLTAAFMQHARNQHVGLVQPEDVDPRWYMELERADLASRLENALETNGLTQTIDDLRPTHPAYSQLRDALDRYQRIADEGGWPTIPEGDVVEVGDTSARVIPLRERLAVTGDLSGPAASETDSTFDEALSEAITAFQRRTDLTVDGLLGPNTREELNIPAEDRIEQIALNLERWHWLPDEMGERYVIVNVPGFRLHAYENQQEVQTMGIIVGKEYNDRSTPIFVDEMEYVIFGPYWNIPQSIADEEILPKAREDRSYLTQNNYEIVSNYGPNAEVYDTYNTSLDRVASGELRLRQEPGPENALGRVKFMFPNQFAVYLHDTPADHLFEESVRAFSHGCIRVERPADFASWVLSGKPKWDRSRIDTAMNNDDWTQVQLDQHIPVYIVYFTSWADADGTVHFRNDLYGFDAQLADELRAHLEETRLFSSSSR